MESKVMNIWDGEIPFDNGEKAEMTIFLPEKKSTGRAIIICPGGAYFFHAWEHEGID